MSLIAMAFVLSLSLWAGIMVYSWAATYPMFRDIGAAEFAAAHRTYERGLPVGVYLPFGTMALSVLGAAILSPTDVPSPARLAAMVALGGGFVTTAFCAAPLHIALIRLGKDRRRIERMLRCNTARMLAALLGFAAAVATLAWR